MSRRAFIGAAVAAAAAADFRVVDTVDEPSAAIATDASFEVVAGSPEIADAPA